MKTCIRLLLLTTGCFILASCSKLIRPWKLADEQQASLERLEKGIATVRYENRVFADSTRRVLREFDTVVRIGFVNVDSVIEHFPIYQSAIRKAHDEQEEYMKQVRALEHDLNSFDGIKTIPDVVNEMRQQVKIVKAIQQLTQNARANTAQRIEPFADKINDAIRDVAQEKNLTFVVKNTDSIYMNFKAASIHDITLDVIKKLTVQKR